ncbi:MAG: Calx-beta domain-containing protein [Luteimonas sp.]
MSRLSRRIALGGLLCCGFGTAPAQVVVSQIYGGGGNSGATLRNDFIELHNTGTAAVSVAGWSVQYASATGTSWATTPLTGSIPAGGYYLVQEAQGSGGGGTLPTPDATGTIAMSGTAGKVALSNSTSALSGACPTGTADLVGFGSTANCFEGSGPTPAPSNTLAVLRAGGGCTDANNNAVDFATGTPTPRNSAATALVCGAPVQATLSITDTSAAEGDSGSKPLFFTINLNQAAGTGGVTVRYATANGTAAAGSDYSAASGSVTIAAGDTSVTISVDINGDTVSEPDDTFTVTLSNPTGAVIGRATGIGTIVNDDVAVTPIGQIQGAGGLSPLVGRTVTTRGIVTGRRSAGYYIQTAAGQDDGNAATSEGLYVFTNTTPPADAAVGNLVQVQGAIAEFIPTADPGQLPLTEMTGSTTVVLGTGNPLPAPMTLSTSLPRPSGALDQLERFEGMRVTAPSFTVVAPTRGNISEPNATGTGNGIFNIVVTGTPRPFREPGIQAPDLPPSGSIPPIPRFDDNPEMLTVISGSIGAASLNVRAGTVITGLVGPLDYSFRRYTILPDPAVAPVVGAQPAPTAARLPTSDEFTIATYNAQRFFDTANDPAIGEPVLTSTAFANRLNKASLALRNYLNAPDIVGLVEIENLSTLQAIASKVNADAVAAGQTNPQYLAYLSEGNDVGGIDVGFLVKRAQVAAGVNRVAVISVTQLGRDTTFVQPDGTPALLNDRPPLQLDAVVHYADGRTFPITTIVIHNRSLNSAEENSATGERVRVKRQKQAEYVAEQVQALQDADPTRRIALIGDFNAFEFNDGFGDSMGTIAGLPAADNQTAVPNDGLDLVDPDLLNLYLEEPLGQRYSYVFEGHAQSLDHILINQALGTAAAAVGLDHARINADFTEVDRSNANTPTRLSDHDPAVAYVRADPIAFADLSITATATPTSVAAGGAMRFDAVVANAGPDAADFPGLGVAFDAELGDLAVTAPSDWSCDAPVIASGATSVACATTSLANGANAAFVLTASAPAAETGNAIVLSASATSQTSDGSAVNDTATAITTVGISADLAVTLSGRDTVVRSTHPAAFAVVVRNDGPNAAPAAALTLRVDTPSGYAKLAAPFGWQCVDAQSHKFEVTCAAADDIPSGDSATFAVLVITSGRLAPPYFTIRGSVTLAANDADLGNNIAAKRVDVRNTIAR